jgi:hypothetical protein
LNFALEPLSYRVLVYPNPFQGILNLEFSDALLSSDEITVSLANVPGKVFIKLKISGLSGNLVTLNLPSLPDGMYILKIESNRFTENVKLMKIE